MKPGAWPMRKQSLVVLIIVLITAAVMWYVYYSSTFTFLALNDAMDYASIGRNVARGDGFVSSYITPLGLANKEGLPHPDLWRAPLWPAALGLFIRVLGATDQAVAVATGSFFIAGAVIVCLLGTEMFGRLVGFVSALVYIFSAQNLVYSTSGMTETMALFVFLLAVYLAVARWARNPLGDILAGAAMGLFYLTRYNALLFVPLFGLFLWYRRRTEESGEWFGSWQFKFKRSRGLWTVVRFLAAFLIIISPWLVRNYLLMGSPLFSLQKFEPAMFTAAYPGYSMYMMLEKINIIDFVKNHPQEVWAKVLAGWNEFREGFFRPEMSGISPYLLGFFLISLVIPFKYGPAFGSAQSSAFGTAYGPANGAVNTHRGVRVLLAACFIIQLAALLVIHFISRLFFMFMPFYIIFATAAVVWALSFIAARLPVKKNGFIAVFTILIMGFFAVTNLPLWSPIKTADTPITGLRDSVKAITDMSSREQLIISNDGHLLAWYGDRYAAKLPYRVDMIPEMEELAPLKLIYLSSRVSWNIPEADDSWRELFWSKPREIYGFKQARVFPDGSVIYRKD